MKLEKALENFKNENKENWLITCVVCDIEDKEPEDQQSYIHDVINNGCESGIVGYLIYYTDTDEFFAKHYKDILELINNYREETGEVPNLSEWNAEKLSWFAYERAMYLLNEYLEGYDISDEDEELD
jgi:hypothetical protein